MIERIKRILRPALIIGALLLLVAGCKPEEEIKQEQQSQTPQEIIIKQEIAEDVRYLTVTGTGKMDVDPDIATLQISVQVHADSAEEAQQQNADTMEAVLTAVKSEGVSDAYIKTQEITVYPDQDATKSSAEVNGYIATNTVTIRIRDIKKTSEIINAASQAGGTLILPIEYYLLEETEAEAYQAALADAVANAYANAQVMVDQAGLQLAGPDSIREIYAEEQNAPEVLLYEGYVPPTNEGEGEDATPTPIQAGQITVNAQVEVVFRLEWPPRTTGG